MATTDKQGNLKMLKSRLVRLASGASLAALIAAGGAPSVSVQAADLDRTPDWSGFYGGAELQLLKPYHSEDAPTGFGYSPAWLGYAGYQSASGLGARARWWGYRDTSHDPASRYQKFSISYLDLEATQAFRLGGMHGRVFGGLRLSSYKEKDRFSNFIHSPSAYGLVAGLEIVRPLAYGFSLFGEARRAFMFDNKINNTGSQEKNFGYSMTEVKLGAEYAHSVGDSGLSFYVRAAAIGHYLDGVSQDDSESTGLAGAAFTLGIRSGGTRPPEAYDGPAFPSGFYGGAEISLVKPYHTEGQLTGYGYDPAYLGFAGYQTASGLGFRARWWHYGENSNDPASRYDKLRMSFIDLEVTQAYRLGMLSGRLSGGLRVLQYKETDGAIILKVPSAYGLVVGAEVSRPVIGGLRIFGEGRYAILFDGKWNNEGTPSKNITLTTTEMKAGLEYAHQLGGTGLSVYARAAATAQYWHGMSDADTESTSLWGAAFTVGLRSGDLGAEMPDSGETFASGIYGGAAISLLTPYHTETQTKGFGMDPAYSAHLGYQSASGLGMRVRGWSYTGKSSDATSRYGKLQMRFLDIDVTQAFRLGALSGRLSGGLKLARYKEHDSTGTDYLSIPSAFGLNAGLELSRPLIGGLSLFGDVHHAIMFAGKTNDEGSIDHNTTFTISEGNLGLEYAHPIGSNGLFYGRVAATAMHWGDASDGDSESTSLFGVTFATGVIFNF